MERVQYASIHFVNDDKVIVQMPQHWVPTEVVEVMSKHQWHRVPRGEIQLRPVGSHWKSGQSYPTRRKVLGVLGVLGVLEVLGILGVLGVLGVLGF